MRTTTKQLVFNLRACKFWNAEGLASALGISEEEAQSRIEELLALELITEKAANVYSFAEEEEDPFSRNSRYGGSSIYLQMPHNCRVTLVKYGLVSTLIEAWERWRMNRLLNKEQRSRVKSAVKYQKQWAANAQLMRNRFMPRY